MPRSLCRICRYATRMTARVANVLTMCLHCRQGVPGALDRPGCMVFVRARIVAPRVRARSATIRRRDSFVNQRFGRLAVVR